MPQSSEHSPEAAPRRLPALPPLAWLGLLVVLVVAVFWWLGRNAPPIAAVPAQSDEYAESDGGAMAEPEQPPPPEQEQEPAASAQPAASAARKTTQDRGVKSAKPRAAAKPAPKPLNRAARPLPGNARPEYPRSALRNGDSGRVLIRVEVDASGAPTSTRIAERSGNRDLDRAALTTVRRWRFDPALRNGQPIPSIVEVPVEFTLQR